MSCQLYLGLTCFCLCDRRFRLSYLFSHCRRKKSNQSLTSHDSSPISGWIHQYSSWLLLLLLYHLVLYALPLQAPVHPNTIPSHFVILPPIPTVFLQPAPRSLLQLLVTSLCESLKASTPRNLAGGDGLEDQVGQTAM